MSQRAALVPGARNRPKVRRAYSSPEGAYLTALPAKRSRPDAPAINGRKRIAMTVAHRLWLGFEPKGRVGLELGGVNLGVSPALLSACGIEAN